MRNFLTVWDTKVQQLILSNERDNIFLAGLLIKDKEDILLWSRMGPLESTGMNLPYCTPSIFHEIVSVFKEKFRYSEVWVTMAEKRPMVSPHTVSMVNITTTIVNTEEPYEW